MTRSCVLVCWIFQAEEIWEIAHAKVLSKLSCHSYHCPFLNHVLRSSCETILFPKCREGVCSPLKSCNTKKSFFLLITSGSYHFLILFLTPDLTLNLYLIGSDWLCSTSLMFLVVSPRSWYLQRAGVSTEPEATPFLVASWPLLRISNTDVGYQTKFSPWALQSQASIIIEATCSPVAFRGLS